MLRTCLARALSGPPLVALLGAPATRRAMERAVCALQRSFSTSASQPVSDRHAAVLVPLFEDTSGEVHVVLTQRSRKLKSHSGEVCLPGGKREPGDEDDVATALREAHEELGISHDAVRIVGRLPCVLSKHLLSVTPVVGVIPHDTNFRPDASEVASVFHAPLRMFLEGGPNYDCRDAQWQDIPYRLHYWTYRFGGKEYLIWGLTAGILISVAERAFGCKAAFDINPPGARPYTDLAFDGSRLVYRSLNGSTDAGSNAAAAVAAALAAVEHHQHEAQL